jgi:hypothetical protein
LRTILYRRFSLTWGWHPYYLSGTYPTGQSQYASTKGRPPFRLDPAWAASGPGLPMAIATGARACPVLSAYGYTGFVVSGSTGGD